MIGAGSVLAHHDLLSQSFLQPDKLFFYLEQEVARETSTEEQIKGYRVKVVYQPVAESEKQVRQEAVGQVILRAFRRLRDQNEG